MKTRPKGSAKTLLLSLLALLLVAGTANAQTSTAPPTKKKTTQTKKSPATPPKPELEPKAIELLKATSDRLAAAHTLSFTAVEIFEHPSRHGHPLAYATKSDVTLQRPDKLRVLIAGRWSRLRVLLRRQNHDGLCTFGKPARGFRCATHD